MSTTATTVGLAERYAELRVKDPTLRIRNAATTLGVSEAELVNTDTTGAVKRLKPRFTEILAHVPSLGRVMALTRNDDVVHERKGVYLNPSLDKGPVGLFVGADIDLRMFLDKWAFAFAVAEQGRDSDRHSLQFFDKQGNAIHKIYLVEESDRAAYDRLVAAFVDPQAAGDLAIEPAPAPRPELPDARVDVEAFRKAWLALEDTHDFHRMLRDHRVSRTQALRLAPPPDRAVPVEPAAFRAVITAAAQRQVPIMVFVGNPGNIQIHTGTVNKVMDARGWFNVLDPDFNLHVREEALTQCWVVRKPTRDGLVTALECYNDAREQLVQLFGKRKPGIHELEEWRSLIAEVEQAHRIA
ncbi:MAG: ChuX/HutX family heme-like substrate-binding protein [Flavobacteriales bacterium]